MNQLLTATYRFLFSHDFSFGLQKAVGIFLPVGLLYLANLYYPFGFDYPLMLIVGYGSLTIGISDQIGPYKHKRNELLASLVAMVIISLLFSYHKNFSIGMIASLTLVTFLSGFVSNFGPRFNAIGFVLVFTAMMAARTNEPPYTYTLFFTIGAVFYYIYTLLISRIFERHIIRHNLSNIYFLLSKHLKNLSACYRQNSDIQKEFKKLIDSQTSLLEELQLLRDLLFRLENPNHDKIKKMIYELITLIEIREVALVPHQEFRTIRQVFPNTDIQIFFRDAFSKAGNNLEEMGLYTLRAGEMLKRLGFKAELRALEYELELLRRENPEGERLEGYQVLIGHYRKVWSLSRQLEKLRSLLIGEYMPDEELSQKSFSRFLSHSYWSRDYIRNNLKIRSNVMRFSIRSAVAMCTALLLVKATSFMSHGFWIAFTLLSLMRPGFSLTKERSRNRIIGTFVGCVVGGLLIASKINPVGMLVIIFFAVVLNNGLMRVHNQLSIAFTTLYVLILLNIDRDLTALQGLGLAGERIIDTVIAAIIAVGFSYLLPYWEKNTIPEHLAKIKENLYAVFLSIEKVWIRHAADDVEFKYCLRETQTSIVDYSNSLTRMQHEPKKIQTYNLSMLNDELIMFQSLLAQLSYLGYLMEDGKVKAEDIPEFCEIFTLIKERFNPANHPDQDDPKPFTIRELKPLIWMLESPQSAQNSHTD